MSPQIIYMAHHKILNWVSRKHIQHEKLSHKFHLLLSCYTPQFQYIAVFYTSIKKGLLSQSDLPPLVVPWEGEILGQYYMVSWIPWVLKRNLHMKQTEKELKKNYRRELKTPEFHLSDLNFLTIMNSEIEEKKHVFYIAPQF